MISAERTHAHASRDRTSAASPPAGEGGIVERLLSQRTPIDALHGSGNGSAASLDGPPGRTHHIAWGDTLGGLAARYGTTVEALAEANGIADPDLIFAGDTLRLPSGADGAGGSFDDGQVAGGVGGVSGDAVGASDAQVRAVVDAMPPDLRAAHPDAAEHVARILEESRAQGLTPDQTAYVLASATHESGMGLYMEEFASGAAYEGRDDLGNTRSGDGVRFKGRGYVQITGRANYADWSSRLGIDLVGNPALAEDPAIAAEILVGGMKEGSFTGRALDDYIGPGRSDFVGARAIVNGRDKAALFATAAEGYAAALASVASPAGRSANPVGPSSVLTLADVGPERRGAAA